MESILAFIAAHYQDVFVAIGALVTAASAIVKLTPSQKDDAVLAHIVALLNHFSVFNPNGDPKAPK